MTLDCDTDGQFQVCKLSGLYLPFYESGNQIKTTNLSAKEFNLLHQETDVYSIHYVWSSSSSTAVTARLINSQAAYRYVRMNNLLKHVKTHPINQNCFLGTLGFRKQGYFILGEFINV